MKQLLPILALVLASVSCDKRETAVPPNISTGVLDPLEGKLLLMHYMPWYETPGVRGRWGSHWTGHEKQHDPSQTDENGLPDIWSHFHPLIGLYDSTDEAVIECQLLQMKLAGVDGVVVDWYGIGDAADYPAIHAATVKVFEVSGRLGMRFSACFEDRTFEHTTQTESEVQAQLTDTMQWLAKEWFPAPHYVRVGGKPLLLNFGPIHVKDAAVWDRSLAAVDDRPAHFALHHLWKGVGADGGFTWAHASAWSSEEGVKERLSGVYRRVSDDPDKVIVSALPGFKDVYEDSHPVIGHREGRTMRESLEVCMEGPWNVVQLVTWNDYGEGTVIEPTHEFGYQFLEIIREARLAEGRSAMATAEDLRMPARLLELRRAGSAETRELDFISRLLASGSIDEARRRLRALSPDPS